MGGTVIYTDGACSGNPGVGGWGVCAVYADGSVHELSGHEGYTTNNRMELLAAIRALELVKLGESAVICTDSQYVKNGITQWIYSWKKSGWMRAKSQPVKNDDLWKELDMAREGREIEWVWTRGHSDNEGNNRADFLATTAIKVGRGQGVL